MSKITGEKLTKLQKKNLQNCKRKVSKIAREKLAKLQEKNELNC